MAPLVVLVVVTLLLVTVTGVLELAGAMGLLWARTAPWAAGGLSLLLVMMFPATRRPRLAYPPMVPRRRRPR